MLYYHEIYRYKIEPEDIAILVENPTARIIAKALLTENFEWLIETWTSCGVSENFALIARGNEFLKQMKGYTDMEKWGMICEGLKVKQVTKRIREITGKMASSQATTEEIMELRNLKRTYRR